MKLLALTVKDWFIISSLLVLLACIFQIRRLKKSIAREVRSRLAPQLILDIDEKENSLYLKNVSFFLAKDIKVQNLNLSLDDSGFKKDITLKFKNLEIIRPQERLKLQFRAFDRGQELPNEVVERIISHLSGACFNISIDYSNIESLRFRISFGKRDKRLFIEELRLADK